MRGAIAAGFLTVGAAAVGAQPHNAIVADIRVGGLVSVQPAGSDGNGGPYLDNSLGGTVPGFSVGVGIWPTGRALLTVELTSTTSLEAVQDGRFVVGPEPVHASHRDTLLSFLPGVRFPLRGALIEAKAGVSLLFGTPQREAFQYDDPGGAVAFTTGADVVVPVAQRLAVVPNVRYSFAVRGDDAIYFGLGRHIMRIGVALRFRLTQ